MRDNWEYFKLEFCSIPNGKYRSGGYWIATALDDEYGGDGHTIEEAMASLIIALAKTLEETGRS